MYKNTNHDVLPPMLILEPIETDNKEAHRKQLDLIQRIKIGRITGSKTVCHCSNGYFDSKVLSRHHAELWSENGKVFIQDVGSSNGTFINGARLSEEGIKSPTVELHPGDRIDFGVDIWNEAENEVLFKKVSVVVDILASESSINLSEKSTDLFHTLKTDSKGNSAKSKTTESSQHAAKGKRMPQDLHTMHSEANQSPPSLKEPRGASSSKAYQEPLLTEQLELLSAENQTLHKKVDILMNQIKLLEKQKNRSSSSSSSSSFSSFLMSACFVVILASLFYFFFILEEQDRAFWIRKVNKKANKFLLNVQGLFNQHD